MRPSPRTRPTPSTSATGAFSVLVASSPTCSHPLTHPRADSAAAYSSTQDFKSAVADAREAIKIDPAFSKAYSRLGHALFSIGEYAEAVEAYEKGLELDPSNATMKSSLATARSKLPKEDKAHEAEGSASVAAPAGGARAAPGAGAGGMPGFPGIGGGGMPDLASLMNNPQIVRCSLPLYRLRPS